MLRFSYSILFLFVTFCNWSQISNVVGARQNGLGNSTLNIRDVWSTKNNPGAFAFLAKTSTSIVYQNRFLLPELGTNSIAIGFKGETGNVGIHLQHTGFELFRSLQLGGTYSQALSPNFGMGISFNYQQTRFGDIYGIKHHFAAGFGIQYKLNKKIFVSANVQNINRSKVSDFQNERLPTFFGIGLAYRISDKVLWLIDFEKEISEDFIVKSGVELSAHEYFDVRFGVNSYPFQSSFGFGTHYKKIQIDLSAIWHAQLGISPTFGLVYEFE